MTLRFLIVFFFTAIALTAQAEKTPSKLRIVCSAKKNHSVALSEINECSGEGTLAKRTRQGKSIILTSKGSEGFRCVITEKLAKQQKVPFEMIWELLETRRAEVVCYYQIPTNGSVEATAFSFRVFLE